MTTSPLSLETTKFHLIWNKDFGFSRDPQAVSLEDLVDFLFEMLETADKATAGKAEGLLARIGQPVVPYLVQGLKSTHNQVKSVCAMALIRIGQPAVEAVQAFHTRNRHRPKYFWIAEFVLSELGMQFPPSERRQSADREEERRVVLQFSKASV